MGVLEKGLEAGETRSSVTSHIQRGALVLKQHVHGHGRHAIQSRRPAAGEGRGHSVMASDGLALVSPIPQLSLCRRGAWGGASVLVGMDAAESCVGPHLTPGSMTGPWMARGASSPMPSILAARA